MPLQPGTTLGPYAVTAKIGEGGMGEVYRARDTKLDRDVALKVLPQAFTDDPDRLARFEREAKVLASLNHTNIGHLYGLEEADGQKALVLELVEGPTLADKIAQGPIPVDEALPIAKQIAEALEVAHEQGIIHRDLKPANIKVKGDGTVKVLDFGLAKAFQPEAPNVSASMSPTISLTAAATQMGMVIGTAAYMAPEQAKGLPVDKRADIWAFGAVLFEMLTGKKLFETGDVSEMLASVLVKDPDISSMGTHIPANIRSVVRRCLVKDPKQRLRDIGDVRLAMEETFETMVPASGGAVVPALRVWQRPIPATITALAIAVIVGLVTWTLEPADQHPVTHFSYALPADQVFQSGARQLVTFSPDGRRFVYNTAEGLALHTLDTGQVRLLFESATLVTNPTFKPDGEWVAYFSGPDAQIKKVAVSGGAPVSLTRANFPLGLSWETDGTILFGETDGVWQVSEDGGTAELVIPARDGESIFGPRLLPGGEWVLFSSTTVAGFDRWNEGNVVAESIDTGERRLLVAGGGDGRYLPTGHLVYALENTLYGIAFDLGRMETVGGPVSVVEGVERAVEPQNSSGTAHFSVSADGNLVHVVSGAVSGQDRALALVDRSSIVQHLDVPPNQYLGPRLAPDGSRLAVQTDGERSVIWTYDLSGETAIQRLPGDGNNYRPLWTPDGERIAFASDRDGPISIYWQNSDGSGVAERLTAAEDGTAHWPDAWSPDGRTLAYRVEHSTSGTWSSTLNEMDLWTLTLDGNEPQVIAADPHPIQELGATFSPDGRWLAYSAGDAGSLEIEVWAQPYPPTGEPRQVSQGFGVMPLWSQDGQELFYRPLTLTANIGQTLRSIRVTTMPSFTFSTEQPVSIGEFYSRAYYRSFDATPDGQQFLVVLQERTDDGAQRLHVVLNWFEELKERVPIP
jgi:serine/threonine-protein kinase